MKKNKNFLLAEENLSEKGGRILKYDMKELREKNVCQVPYSKRCQNFLYSFDRLLFFLTFAGTCDVLNYMKNMFPVCYGGYLRLNEDKTSFNKPG